MSMACGSPTARTNLRNGDDMKLIADIRHHLATLNSGQQQREAAVLLREAATALEAMQRGSQRLSNAERDAIDWAIYAAEQWYEHTTADTLRSMLERLSQPATSHRGRVAE